MKFGDYLKKAREDHGLTQPQAAQRIGMEQSYLSKLETGKAVPSEEMLMRLVEGYSLDLDEMGRLVESADLERLRDIGAVRDLIRRREGMTASTRRRWLMAGVLLLVTGGALMSFTLTSVRYPQDQWVYGSKGVIEPGESDFVFEDVGFRGRKTIRVPNPAFCAEARPAGERQCELEPFIRVEDPIMQRIKIDYQTLDRYRGDRFTRSVEGGRRVYEEVDRIHKRPAINTHMGHALAVALLMGGLASFFVARRW